MSGLVESAEVVVVGGGIAGLAAAWHLAELGLRDVVLLEAEPHLVGHSSSRNAAIHMPLEESLAGILLAQRSRALVDAKLGTSWIDATGLVYIAENPDALDELRFWARQASVFHENWSPAKLRARAPLLDDRRDFDALALPLGGVMDVHRLTQFMAQRARRAGARLLTGCPTETIEVENGAVAACVLKSGERIRTSRVVIACGAWAQELGARVGCPLPLSPLRRHLAQLTGEGLSAAPRMPVVWRVDDPVYLRPESGGVLASPCDEVPYAASLPPSDDAQLEVLSQKLQRLSGSFATAGVRRAWACLRTMAPDRESVVGADPRLRGLYWNAGLGGWGMTVGAATGEVLAHAVLGRAHPLHTALSPERLF